MVKETHKVNTDKSLALKQSKLPIKQSSLPNKQNKLPIKHSKLPVKISNLSIKQSNLPTKQTKLQVKISNLPTKQTKLPVKQSNLTTKQTKLPIRHPRQSTKPSGLLGKVRNMTNNASNKEGSITNNASNKEGSITNNASNKEGNMTNNASNKEENMTNTASIPEDDETAPPDVSAKDEEQQQETQRDIIVTKPENDQRRDTTVIKPEGDRARTRSTAPGSRSDDSKDSWDPEKKLIQSIEEVVDMGRTLQNLSGGKRHKVNPDTLPPELAALYKDEPPPELSARLSLDPAVASSSEVAEAMARIKHNFILKTVERELDDMNCMYLDARKKTIYQNKQLAEYNERIESLQEKINKDPSRRKAVFIASQYGREKDELEKEKEEIKLMYEDQSKDMQMLTEVNARLAKDKKQAYHTNTESQKNMQQMEMQISKLENEKMRLTDNVDEKEKLLREAQLTNQMLMTNMKLDDGLKRDSSKETDTSSFKKILELTLEKQKVIDKRYNDAVYKNELLEKRIKKHEDGEKSTNKDFLILKAELRMRRKAFLKMKSLARTWQKKATSRYKQLDVLMTDHQLLQKAHDGTKKEVQEIAAANKSLEIENRKITHQASSQAKFLKEKENAISDLKTIEHICIATKRNLDGIIKSNAHLIESLKQSGHVAEMKLINTRSKLKEKSSNFTNCAKLYARADAEVKHLAQEGERKETVISMAGQELRRMVNKVAEMAEQVRTYENHYHDIQMVVEKLEKETNALAKRFEVLGRNKHNLVKKNQQLFHDCEELQEHINTFDYETKIKDSTIQTMAFNDSKQQQIFRELSTQIERDEKEIYQHSMQMAAKDNTIHELKMELKLDKVERERMSLEIERKKEECRQERIMRKDLMVMKDNYVTQSEQHRLEKSLEQEKVKAATKQLTQAEFIVNSKLSDVKMLCMEVKQLRKTLKNHASVEQELLDLKTAHNELGRCHVQTLGRVRAAEEMGPQNVHRLRFIKAKNTSTYELHVKIHVLTKKLISKSTEVVEKEQLLIDKNKLYMELKTMVSIKFPSITLRQNMEKLKELNKKKDRQLKALKAEMNFLEGSQASVDNKMAMKDKELRDVKEKYLKQKSVKDRSSHNNNNVPKRHPSPVKILGGGYTTVSPRSKRTVGNGENLDNLNKPSYPIPSSPNPMRRKASPRWGSGFMPQLPPLRSTLGGGTLMQGAQKRRTPRW